MTGGEMPCTIRFLFVAVGILCPHQASPGASEEPAPIANMVESAFPP